LRPAAGRRQAVRGRTWWRPAKLLEQCDVLLMEVKSAEAGRAHGVPSVT